MQFTVARAAAAHGPGPKSTPAFADGKLFAIGMTGIVTGFDADTGQQIWQKPAPGVMTEWTSHSFSPLVYGETLIVSGYQNPLVALAVTNENDRWSTETVWENTDVSLYMSDAVMVGDTLVGFSHRQSGQFFAVDPRTGRTLWTSEPRQAENAALGTVGEYCTLQTEIRLGVRNSVPAWRGTTCRVCDGGVA